ncbi:cytochrome oxidase [Photobacterium sp.]|uniref:cytochrome oxidase n=1 Tax=Photobacterium sp. TaxID=660 RepID=UPI00299EDDAA|nr:cytochrome oxidase [Photobacterium sp.]MDX1302692.1 cytochrome oxidase [Photobacterium sp.]
MKKHGMLLLLLGVFLLPLLLAKIVLDLNWYQGGVTNRGQLLAFPLASDWLTEPGKWQLVYLLPPSCDEPCQGALFNLRQVPQAIGADQQRVSSVVLVVDLPASFASDNAVQSQAAFQKPAVIIPSPTDMQTLTAGLQLMRVPDHVVAQIETLKYGTAAIYLADPLGNVMMAYPLAQGKTAILAQGKDLLRDLKRLLKVSRIG